MSVQKWLFGLLAERSSIPERDIKGETTWEELGTDSLDRTEIVMNIEEKYTIEIPDADAHGLKTAGDVVRYIEGKIGSQTGT